MNELAVHLTRGDRALAAAFLDDADEAAFRVLYRRHSPALYQLVLRLGGRAGEAEEILQETWLRAAEGLAGFRWQSSLATWLRAIAVNCWRELVRADLRLVSESPDAPEPAAQPRRSGEAVDLERAIAQLPPGYRQVLVLHDVEGYTHEEIAGLLGVEAGTSKSQLSHARRKVRTWLAAASAPISTQE